MQRDVEMYWICLTYVCSKPFGMPVRSYPRWDEVKELLQDGDLLPKTWLIKTRNHKFFAVAMFFKQKIHSFEPFGVVSPNKRDLESNLLIPQEIVCMLCLVFFSVFFINFGVCSLNLLFQSLPSHFSWPRWGVLFEDRWRLRPHNYAKWLKCLGYAWIGSYKNPWCHMMPAFGSKGNFFQLSFKSFHFTPRSNVLLQTTDKFAQLEEGECQILKNQLLTMEAQMEGQIVRLKLSIPLLFYHFSCFCPVLMDTRFARTVLDLVASCWVISIAQHCTRCHDMKERLNKI